MDTNMNTNMKELNLNEMEKINGGRWRLNAPFPAKEN